MTPRELVDKYGTEMGTGKSIPSNVIEVFFLREGREQPYAPSAQVPFVPVPGGDPGAQAIAQLIADAPATLVERDKLKAEVERLRGLLKTLQAELASADLTIASLLRDVN